MLQLKSIICCVAVLFIIESAQAQGILKKIKQKTEQAVDKAADKVLEKKADEAVGNNSGESDNGNAPNSVQGKNTPRNKGGQGLVSTPPDVNKNLGNAETAFKSGNYSEARYAVQQAMLGVEMEIGNQILKDLPETLSNLKKVAEEDKVTSTGWGWAGLTIHREYNEGDQQLNFTISNNAAFMQAVNMYFTNSAYMQTSGEQQKWKQTKIQENRAIIEYDENSGYKLTVPIGQTSLLIYEGINFNTEEDFMKASGLINIEKIKKQLGEN